MRPKLRAVRIVERMRVVIALAVSLMLSVVAAQPAGVPYRIGFLGNSTETLEANLLAPFREGLHDLGYVEGRNLRIEYRWAEGRYERFPDLVGELLAARAQVIVTAGTPATLAVKQKAPTTPLVMIAVGDPVGAGIVPSLSRPGGHITGLTSISPELDGKRLELLREILPDLAYVAILWNSASPLQFIAERRTQAVAETLGIKVLSLGVRDAEGLERAFAELARARPQALLVLADRLFLHHRERIAKFAAEQRLPGVHAYRELVDAGALMSYGPSYEGMHRRAAYFVDRILKGAQPGDLPIERPGMFELVVNLEAAKALGLVIPEAVLLRATKVIR